MAARGERDQILSQAVSMRGANVPFGALSLDDVRSRADELRSAVGFGPTARVAPVARAWRELALEMERAGVGSVGELDGDTVVKLAPQMWVVPPGGTLL